MCPDSGCFQCHVPTRRIPHGMCHDRSARPLPPEPVRSPQNVRKSDTAVNVFTSPSGVRGSRRRWAARARTVRPSLKSSMPAAEAAVGGRDAASARAKVKVRDPVPHRSAVLQAGKGRQGRRGRSLCGGRLRAICPIADASNLAECESLFDAEADKLNRQAVGGTYETGRCRAHERAPVV